MATQRDYYDILGVKRGATEEEIKRAYRKLARQHHPDVSKDPDASRKFSEVQEAYDVLSDEEKRKAYDRFGHAGVGAGAGAGGGEGYAGRGGQTYTWTNVAGGPGGGGFDEGDIGSIFEEIFGGRPGGSGMGGFGSSGFGTRARAKSRPQRGRDIDHAVTVGFEEAARGGTHTVRVRRGGSTQTIDVTIPPGIHDGAKLRVRGAGAPSTTGGPPGDLILNISVGSHPWFRREGLDLLIDVPISIAEAALGTKVTLPTLNRRHVDLTIPKGSSSGTRLRVREMGIEDSAGKKGDLYAVVKIVAPRSLNPEDEAALKKMKDRLGPVRTGKPWE